MVREDLPSKRRWNATRHNENEDSTNRSYYHGTAAAAEDNAPLPSSSAAEGRECYHECQRPSTPHRDQLRQQRLEQERKRREARLKNKNNQSKKLRQPKAKHGADGQHVGFTCGCVQTRAPDGFSFAVSFQSG